MDTDQNGWQSTEAGQRMMATLAEERTLSAVTRMLQRMEAIEQSLENLHQAVQQAPQMISIATDAVDETYTRAKENGVDLDQRVNNLLKLVDKISDPVIAERLESTLSSLNQMPGMAAMLVDTVDDEVVNLKQKGILVEDRITGLVKILEVLTEPRLVAQLEGVMAAMSKMPDTIAMVADMADDGMRELIDSGVDPQELGAITTKIIRSLSNTAQSDIESSGGIFKMLRKFADHDRQKALGFLLDFLKNLGKEL
ncbi:MAG: DUF1641 domain-containing protein [Saprospiraceae bacterium]|nr:DUF1641 domain-containing protein [Saprospiraceae bacterium]